MNEDHLMIVKLSNLISSQRSTLGLLFAVKTDKDLYQFVIRKSQQMGNLFQYKLLQKIEWVFKNREEFPKCENPNCNKVLNDPKFFKNLKHGYKHHCCMSCSTSDPSVKTKHEKTTAKNHNGNIYFRDMKKDRQTRLKHGGSPTWNNSKKAKNTLKIKYGNETYNNSVKAKQTYFERTGFENPSQNPKIKQRISETKTKRYLKKYGSPTYFGSESFRQCCLERFGCEHPMQNVEIQKKAKKKYVYDNQKFDSKDEIAFYIWLRDNKIQFQHNHNVSIKYEFCNRIHLYFPDFIVNEKLIEIKGDQFFDLDGKMINPYDSSKNDLYEAKHQCMIANNVHILRSSHMIFFIKYVKQKYGSRFLDNLKNNSCGNKNHFSDANRSK